MPLVQCFHRQTAFTKSPERIFFASARLKYLNPFPNVKQAYIIVLNRSFYTQHFLSNHHFDKRIYVFYKFCATGSTP